MKYRSIYCDLEKEEILLDRCVKNPSTRIMTFQGKPSNTFIPFIRGKINIYLLNRHFFDSKKKTRKKKKASSTARIIGQGINKVWRRGHTLWKWWRKVIKIIEQ